jgi:ATP-dependent Clp protease adaptor protein ClpS
MAEENANANESSSSGEGGGAAAAATKSKPKRQRTTKPGVRKLPPFNVVLLDDDDHTYEYVIEMLGDIFGYDVDKALDMAEEVDGSGRVIVLTTHKEHAELKRDQILGYGADPRDQNSAGSMTAIVEPAEE